MDLFQLYRHADAVLHQSPTQIRLKLRFDLHESDCGAPDSYGHDTELTLNLVERGGECLIKSAQATNTFFGDESFSDGRKKWSVSFSPEGQPNLAAPNFRKLTLRSDPTGEALVLDKFHFYYFKNVKHGQELADELWSEASPKGLAYGATSAASLHWYATLWTSPLPSLSEGHASQTYLDLYNQWATKGALRDDLTALASRTFWEADKRKTTVELSAGDPPLGATLIADRALSLDDKEAHPKSFERYIYRFSRKPCDSCSAGATGWWLWSAEAQWHCASANGTLTITQERCTVPVERGGAEDTVQESAATQ